MRAIRLAVSAFAAAAAIPVAALARPADINADAFCTDAIELLGKGMAAMKDAGQAARDQNAAAAKAGHPLYCVPEQARKQGIGPQFVVDRLGAIPPPRRKAPTLRQAWREILIREYPCG